MSSRAIRIVFSIASIVALIALVLEPSFAASATLAGSVAALAATWMVGAEKTQPEVGNTNSLISKDASVALLKVAREEIPDEGERHEWNQFDLKFMADCVRTTHRGLVFDGDAAQKFLKPENDRKFRHGSIIYARTCILIGEKHPDHLTLNKTAAIYTEGRLQIRKRFPQHFQ
jgi:hypothetical protein